MCSVRDSFLMYQITENNAVAIGTVTGPELIFSMGTLCRSAFKLSEKWSSKNVKDTRS